VFRKGTVDILKSQLPNLLHGIVPILLHEMAMELNYGKISKQYVTQRSGRFSHQSATQFTT